MPERRTGSAAESTLMPIDAAVVVSAAAACGAVSQEISRGQKSDIEGSPELKLCSVCAICAVICYFYEVS